MGCIGGFSGVLFFVSFSGVLGVEISEGVANFIKCASIPFLYFFVDILGANSMPFIIFAIAFYWAILGIIISCGLARIYFFVSRKSKIIN